MEIPIDQIKLARAAGAEAARTEPRAIRAWYEDGKICIEFQDGARLDLPACQLQGLQNATPEQLATVEITPAGSGLHWEELDADLSVPNLVVGLLGSAAWMREMGKLGGRSTSEKKQQASRANGQLGGRPRKETKKGGGSSN